MSWGNKQWAPPKAPVRTGLNQAEFIQQYTLARASVLVNGIEPVYVVRDAAKAWRQLQKELGNE